MAIPNLFRREKETGPLEQTYSILAEEFHFGITLSETDQVASMPFRSLMAAYVAHKKAIERSEEALFNADLTPSDKGPFSKKLTEEEQVSKELFLKITQDLQASKEEVLKLPEPVFKQVMVDLNLIEAPEETVAEADVSAQLLADKNTEKAERQQRKEQEKLINTQSKEFCKNQRTTKLEEDGGIKALKMRVDELTHMAKGLEEQAKPKEVEVVVQKQIPAGYLKAQELERERGEPITSRVPGFGDDSLSE